MRAKAESFAMAAETAAPVLDEAKMAELVALMGRDWVAMRLGQFAEDLQARLATLDRATPPELARIVHGLAGVAGHCGFIELFDICASIQGDARQGGGLDRLAALREVAQRALAIAAPLAQRRI